MTRLRETNPTLQASILDWIPARYHARIQANTVSGPDDHSNYVEAAINECGAYELTVPPGTYALSRQLVMTNAVRLRARGATFLATADLDTLGDGRGAMLSFNQLAPQIEGLAFDCNSKNANGIYVASCSSPRFERMSCGNIKAGYAGIRGGSILYGEIDRSAFTGAGRSVDFQKGWELRSAMTGSPTLTFVSAGVGLGGTITRSSGSWITDGYVVSDRIRVELAANATNSSEFLITGRTATVLTFTAGTLANEGPTAGCIVSKVSGSYYGFHDAVISKTLLYGNEGARLAGYTKIRDTDHEHYIYQPATRNEDPSITAAPLCAAVVLGEEISRSDHTFNTYEFSGLYMELAEGTAGKERAIGTATSGNIVLFNGGQIYGQVGPAAGSTCFYNLIVGNSGAGTSILVKRFENGFEGQYQGTGGHSGLLDLSRFVVTSDVTNVFKAGTGVQPDEGVRAEGLWGDLCYTSQVGLSHAPNQRFVIQTITPTKAPANISFANSRKYALSGGGTLDTDYFVTLTGGGFPGGAEVELTFAAGSTWTVDSTSGKSLKLVAGANRLFLPGETLILIVDAAGVIRERGHA